MTDIKVKTTTKRVSSIKSVKINKLKASEKSSAAEDDFIHDEEEEINQDEAQCLLRLALNIKKTCYEQDDDQENNGDTESFQPVDQLMTSEIHNRISDYEKSGPVVEEDIQDYVVVGCRFPNGVVICLGKNKTLLRGVNDMPDQDREPHYENVGFTKVIRAVWKAFLKTHQNWPPILNGSVYVVDNKEQ